MRLKLEHETKKFPDKFIVDQLKRASLSIVLNIAEWTWRYTKADKRNFYTISKGSVFEVISMLDILKDRKTVSDEEYWNLFEKWEEIVRMLIWLINSLK